MEVLAETFQTTIEKKCHLSIWNIKQFIFLLKLNFKYHTVQTLCLGDWAADWWYSWWMVAVKLPCWWLQSLLHVVCWGGEPKRTLDFVFCICHYLSSLKYMSVIVGSRSINIYTSIWWEVNVFATFGQIWSHHSNTLTS